MALNDAITGSLSLPSPPPPDAQCPTNLTEFLNGAVNYLKVNVVNPAQVPGDGSSIAQLALNTANTALQTANATAAQVPQKRAITAPMSVPDGFSLIPLSWTPPMPDANYEVNVTFFGPSTNTAATFRYAVVYTSRTVDGCQITLHDVPATGDWYITWTVSDLSNV